MENFWISLMGPATMHFNEENLKSLIMQPANAWTNLFYIIAGILIFMLYPKDNNNYKIRLLPWIAILVGISSFLYHAHFIFLFQVFDLSSMFLLSSFLLVFNMVRLKIIKNSRFFIIYALVFLISLFILLLIQKQSGEILFAVMIVSTIVLEIICGLKNKSVRYRDLYITIGLIALALGFWLLDVNHLLFTPQNHIIQGHGLWHFTNSFCFLFLYKFYRQFEVIEAK